MTTITTPDPRAWRVAIALGLASPEPPDWARWAAGLTAVTCPVCEGQGGDLAHRECGPCEACNGDGLVTLDVAVDFGWSAPTHGAPTPVPAPWDAAAYLADCARRGVEPGPLPSLEWTGPDGAGWRVEPSDCLRVTFHRRGFVIAEWDGVDDSIGWCTAPGVAALCIDMPRDIAGRVYTAATAAAKAMVQT